MMRPIYKFLFLLLVINTFYVACAYPKSPPNSNSLHLDWIDNSSSPQQNFYLYANGNWLKKNPIPAEYSSWSNFNILNQKVMKQVKAILLDASRSSSKNEPIIQKIGDFYYSGMNEKSINEQGIKPLEKEFSQINKIKNLADLNNEIIHLHLIGVDVFFNFGSMQDFKNSNNMIAVLSQGGLGLPNRDYYLKENTTFQKIRAAYLKHIQSMFELLGDEPSQAKENSYLVMQIETQLAKASMSQIEQRDPHAIYHIKNIKELQKLAPNFSWNNYFKKMGQSGLDVMNVAMPDFFKTLNAQLVNTNLTQWKTYMRWHLIDDFSPYLSQAFVDEHFKMIKVINGNEKILPRWKRVVATESAALGFAIGEIYVKKYFPAESKRKILQLIDNIRMVLKTELKTLSWMDADTKKAALNKLELMEMRVGYPTKWWDYSLLNIDRGPYVLNVIRANQFLIKRELNKIGKPVDRSEWAMVPQMINAYYDPSMNNLNIPAGILQAPFFDPNAPDAINYGGIGFVIGHEMTHGFDDQGAQFNGQGNLENWWTAKDLAQFKQATQCIVKQFSNYVVNGELPVQGELVVGEAAADLGGLTLAYKAFKQTAEYKKAKSIQGFSPEQQFFLSSAHIWAVNIRPEQLQNQVTTDPHPPAMYRVNGSVANMPAFYREFHISENVTDASQKKCTVW